MSKLTVYGCGGMGITAILRNQSMLEQAGAKLVCIDSSDSNIGNITVENKYQLKGRMGSGGNQLENIEQFKDSIPDILSNYQPSTFNIILASTSGGSGSVASMYLAREITKRGKVAVLVMLTTSDSLRRINNTINVLKTLESMSSSIEQPLVLMTHHQKANETINSGDIGINFNLSTLTYLFTTKFNDLDDMDITNFFFYNKVTKVPPQLVCLTSEALTAEYIEQMMNAKPPISLLNIINNDHRESAVININSVYSKNGYDVEFDKRCVSDNNKVGYSFYIDNQSKHDLLERFEKLKVESQEANAASVSKKLDTNGSVTNDDFVFVE